MNIRKTISNKFVGYLTVLILAAAVLIQGLGGVSATTASVQTLSDLQAAIANVAVTDIVIENDITLDAPLAITAGNMRDISFTSVSSTSIYTIFSANNQRHFNISGGGSIALAFDGNIILDGNNAGGGINSTGTDLTLSEAVLQNNSAANGGAVFGSVITIDGGTYTDNSATGSGGAIFGTTSVTVLDGTLIDNNFANSHGGGISGTNGTTVNIEGGTISRNRSQNGSGGGIFIGINATVNMSGGIISDNSVLCNFCWGGGIGLNSSSTVNMTDGIIANNTAALGGGMGDLNGSCTYNISGGSIIENRAPSNPGQGGGIYVNSNGTLNISGSDTILYGNSAASGGAIFSNLGSDVHITDSEVSGNSAVNSGGAIYTHTYRKPWACVWIYK